MADISVSDVVWAVDVPAPTCKIQAAQSSRYKPIRKATMAASLSQSMSSLRLGATKENQGSNVVNVGSKFGVVCRVICINPWVLSWFFPGFIGKSRPPGVQVWRSHSQ